MKKIEAATTIVREMCDSGHMHGFLGDTSPEYQEDQVARILDMPPQSLHAWVVSNERTFDRLGIRDAGAALLA